MEVIWVCWCKEQATFLLEVEIEEGNVSSRRAKLLCVHTDVNVYSSLELDFFADIQNFYDKTPPRHRLSSVNPDYFHGLHKELPAGGTVTQVLHASVPRIGYWWGGMRGDGGGFWHQFMFRS